MEPLLEVRGLEFSYGHLQVLFGVDLQAEAGGRVVLLGPNGAGKSTLLKLVAGLLQPSSGEIRFKGTDVTTMKPAHRVRLGMCLVEGGRSTFSTLSVLENLRVGAYPVLANRQLVEDRLELVLSVFTPLRPRLGQVAGTLSGGEQQMLALGRALMSGAELLMIDELSLGLAPVVMQQVVRMVEDMVDRGTTLLLVEQSLNVALTLANDAMFMDRGEVHFTGPTTELLGRDDLVRSVFFGKESSAP